MGQFVLKQLARASLGHNTFIQEALALIGRSGEGSSWSAVNGAITADNRDQVKRPGGSIEPVCSFSDSEI